MPFSLFSTSCKNLFSLLQEINSELIAEEHKQKVLAQLLRLFGTSLEILKQAEA